MGWTFSYVSTYGTDFPFDFGLALTPEQAEQIPEVQEMLKDPPEMMQDWSQQTGADLKDGLREAPSFIAFARENGTVYHTYTVTAPDRFVTTYSSFLLERTPKPDVDLGAGRRKDGVLRCLRTGPQNAGWSPPHERHSSAPCMRTSRAHEMMESGHARGKIGLSVGG